MNENTNELKPILINEDQIGQAMPPTEPIESNEEIEEKVADETFMTEPINPDEDPLVSSAYLGETEDGDNVMIIHRETLEAMVTDVMPSVRSKGVNPIESMILIKINQNELQVESTDGVTRIIRTTEQFENPSKKGAPAFSYGGDVSISLCIEAKILHAALKKLKSSTIIIKNKVGVGFSTLKSGRSEIKLQTLEGDMFPLRKEYDGKQKVIVFDTADELRDMYSSVNYACAKHESRPVLTGVFHRLVKDRLEVISTDSHRLALARSHEDDLKFSDSDLTAIVPSTTISSIIRLLTKRDDDKVTLTISEREVSYELKGVTVISSQIEGKYPDMTRLIPTGSLTNFVSIPVSALEDAATFVSLLDENSSKLLQIQIIPEFGQLRISSGDKTKGGYTNDIKIEKSETMQKISLLSNFEYVKNAIAKFSDHAEIMLHYDSNSRPFLILDKHLGLDMNIDLILPVRRSENEEDFEIEDFRGEETFNPIEQILNSISNH